MNTEEIQKRLERLHTEVDWLLSIDQDTFTVEAEIQRLRAEYEAAEKIR